MAKASDIVEALTRLDPANENHWTGEGLPRLHAVRTVAGDPEITRQDITDAAPKFLREAAANFSPASAGIAENGSDPDAGVSGVVDSAGSAFAAEDDGTEDAAPDFHGGASDAGSATLSPLDDAKRIAAAREDDVVAAAHALQRAEVVYREACVVRDRANDRVSRLSPRASSHEELMGPVYRARAEKLRKMGEQKAARELLERTGLSDAIAPVLSKLDRAMAARNRRNRRLGMPGARG